MYITGSYVSRDISTSVLDKSQQHQLLGYNETKKEGRKKNKRKKEQKKITIQKNKPKLLVHLVNSEVLRVFSKSRIQK